MDLHLPLDLPASVAHIKAFMELCKTSAIANAPTDDEETKIARKIQILECFDTCLRALVQTFEATNDRKQINFVVGSTGVTFGAAYALRSSNWLGALGFLGRVPGPGQAQSGQYWFYDGKIQGSTTSVSAELDETTDQIGSAIRWLPLDIFVDWSYDAGADFVALKESQSSTVPGSYWFDDTGLRLVKLDGTLLALTTLVEIEVKLFSVVFTKLFMGTLIGEDMQRLFDRYRLYSAARRIVELYGSKYVARDIYQYRGKVSTGGPPPSIESSGETPGYYAIAQDGTSITLDSGPVVFNTGDTLEFSTGLWSKGARSQASTHAAEIILAGKLPSL